MWNSYCLLFFLIDSFQSASLASPFQTISSSDPFTSSFSCTSEEVKILKALEYPSKDGKTSVMTVTYKKPLSFATQWVYMDEYQDIPGWGSDLFDWDNLTTKPAMNGTMTETVISPTEKKTVGIYVFSISDTTNNTVCRANFTQIFKAPSEISISLIGNSKSNNLQYRRIYKLKCTGKFSNPLPEIQWEINSCIKDVKRCENKWKPLKTDPTVGQSVNDDTHWEVTVGIVADQVGTIRCLANNSLGRANSEEKNKNGLEIIPSDIPNTEINSGIYITPKDGAESNVESDINITCQLHKYLYLPEVSWMKTNADKTSVKWIQGTNDSESPPLGLEKQHRQLFDETSTNFSNRFVLQLHNISMSDAGEYACVPQEKDFDPNAPATMNLTVADYSAPKVWTTDNDTIYFSIGDKFTISCMAHGVPQTKLTWYKDRKRLNFSGPSDRLKFARAQEVDQGQYVCKAENKIGSDQHSFRLIQRLPESFLHQNRYYISAGTVVGLILVIFAALLARLALVSSRRNKDLWKLQRELEENHSNEFDPTLPIFERIERGITMQPGYPYCLTVDKLIFDRKDLVILGDGFFGVVLQVGLKMSDGSVQQVALKRPKSNWDMEQYRTLYKEICVMTYLGKHPNIVNMIGCVNNIANGQLYLVMELCKEGSLLQLLQGLRESKTFYSELQESADTKETGENHKCYLHESLPQWPSMKAELKGYRFHTDLISYAYQIASGMEYLASIQFVHRDLAARNILLSNNFEIAKIADFGLSHQMYCEQNYFNEKEKKMMIPQRFSAPECFLHREFSVASDVWSFGVVLGELFSLGEVPFSHVTGANFNPHNILTGEIRPLQPKLATDSVYHLIVNCCRPERKDRITFTEAKSQLTEEFKRCNPEHFQQLLINLNNLQSSIERAISDPVVNSIFQPYKPKSVLNSYIHSYFSTSS